MVIVASLFMAEAILAEENVTAKYLANPSFEADNPSSLTPVNNSADGLRGYTLSSPTGWTVSGTSVTTLLVGTNCYTDNNFGKVTSVADGSYAYYLRMGWNAGETTMKQTISLSEGKYRFTVSQRTAYVNSATSSLTIFAGTDSQIQSFQTGSTGCFTTMAWQPLSVVFSVAKETTIDLGFKITWQSGGSCVMLDDVQLVQLDDDYVEPEDPTESEVGSFTEGIITSNFVSEADMMADLLQMLADFSKYMKNNWNQAAAPNSIGESCGFFSGENTAANNEQGVRPNADMSMICAFLTKYAKGKVTLPAGVSWDDIEEMAMKSLIFAYSTHKANKLKVCSGNNYWGSTSTSDAVWESSLWAMSVAYSAYFQWDKLSDSQKTYVYNMLKAECNYELYRSIPTGYAGDTKAEENGWEADVLAVTLGLFPNDELAPKWFERMRLFAVNSYSHAADVNNTAVLDEGYEGSVASLYKGQNLYADYTLQNHNLFHTSYQNVVMQELGEATLALQLFQGSNQKWKSNALMHNNQEVMDSVLNWLALTDGELAMPNGNDWSLFLYDQITSYSTMATFLKDPNALMLENLAYKYIKARQKTTSDGSWLLRPDVAQRRMGVEAHRVMMTYLMHLANSTADVTPTRWEDFRRTYSAAKLLPCQNVVRAFTDSRFTCFSWSEGLKSYTGYFASNSPDKNKIVVPYRANNTGNLLGWYDVEGKSANATPVCSGIYQLDGDGYVMNGELNTNDGTLNHRFAIYSTPGNAIIYLDNVIANANATISAEKGGLLAISTDELMKTARTLYYNKADDTMTHKQSDGSTFFTAQSDWVNIDNELGVIGKNNKQIAFGDRGANNSIYTSKLYPMYSATRRTIQSGDIVDARNLVYYSNQTAEETKHYSTLLQPLTSFHGLSAVIAPDADCAYALICNFRNTGTEAQISNLQYNGYAPIFSQPTTIKDNLSSVSFRIAQNNSVAQPLYIMLQGSGVEAQLADPKTAYIIAKETTTVKVNSVANIHSGAGNGKTIELKQGEIVKVLLNENGEIILEQATMPEETPQTDYTGYIVNPSFDGNSTAGWTGSPTVNSGCAEKWQTTVNISQTVTGLPRGLYRLTCQGFYRNGGYNDAAKKRSNGTEKLIASLQGNGNAVPLCSIFEEAGKCGGIGINQSTYGYIPNSMEQASVYFMKGLYNNHLYCLVDNDGTLKISIYKSTTETDDWTIFDNFTLTKVPFSEVLQAYLQQPTDSISSEYDIDNDGKLTIADLVRICEQ